MSASASEPDAVQQTNFKQPWFLPVLVGLFVASGCAALIYEVVWFQLLQLVVGSSAIALGMLLGTYMGGMCLGSLLLPRFVSARRNPLRVYAVLEAGIGAFGVLILFGMPALAQVYTLSGGPGFAGLLLRGVIGALCLLPPTLLMGATLPAMSRWVEATPRGVSWLGFFYGGNIAGAVLGCLLAGFYLLRVHDTATATCVAAAINGAVALLAFGLARHAGFETRPRDTRFGMNAAAPGSGPVYLAIALSGCCALGAEVVWTRLLSLLLGGTVYTFSVILAVFLLGLGIGSGLGSFLARASARPRLALGLCQLFLMAGIAWTAWMLAQSLPYWPVNPSLSRSPWLNFQLDLARCLWAILPATILWGASFPMALAAVASGGQDPGRLVGRVYAANTVGAIVGAMGTSLLLIGWVGTQRTQQLLIGLSGVAAALMFLPRPGRPARVTGLLVVIVPGALLAWSVPALPWKLVAYGRYVPTYHDDRQVLYVGEGLNASVAITEMSNGIRNFHVSGKVEASTDIRDMRMERMLGHLPALFHPNPRSVLVVGCGAGVTAGSFTLHPEVERIVVCEIEPLIPQKVAPVFARENYGFLNDPRVRVVYDDARHYVLTTKEKFDVITSDPIHPWVKGAATLYTREYFEICKRHLNPGGLVVQWVPLYESDTRVVRSELVTFFEAFPDGTLWSNDDDGLGYDTVALGSAGSLRINVEVLQQRLNRNRGLAQSLRDVGFNSAAGLLAVYAGRGSDLKPWLAQAEVNRDRNLRLQYLAGLAANRYDEHRIFSDLLAYRRYPEELFEGSEISRAALRELLKQPARDR